MLFLAAGMLLSAILRYAVSEVVGQRIIVPDRLAGAILGAVRVGLLAVVVVLVFDRIIPASRSLVVGRLAAAADPMRGRPRGPAHAAA